MLYYIAGADAITPDWLKGAALEYAFEAKPRCVPVTRGPLDRDGPSGVILSDPGAPLSDRLGYYPEQQTWRRVPGNSVNVCVGVWNDARPGPGELARRAGLNGHVVELADGNQWNCPVALRWQEGDPVACTPTLPHSIDLDEDGKWVTGDVLPSYRHLWQIAEAWQGLYAALDPDRPEGEHVEVPLELEDIFDDAVRCLSVNYRVSRIEAAMLGLLTEHAAAAVLNALIDYPGLLAITQKKTGD